MRHLDMMRAINNPETNNFTAILFRLLLKSDSDNRAKLATVYPLEVKMVELYRTNCPYLEERDIMGQREVNFVELERMAREK